MEKVALLTAQMASQGTCRPLVPERCRRMETVDRDCRLVPNPIRRWPRLMLTVVFVRGNGYES